MELSRDELLMKLGSAKSKVPAAWRLIDVKVEEKGAGFTYRLNRKKLKIVLRREGRYLLRTNLTETDPVKLWNYYLQLVQVEEAFRTLKSDLAIRPIFHQKMERIEAHVLVCSSDCSCFRRVAVGRWNDPRSSRVRSPVSLYDRSSRRKPIIPAVPSAA